MVSEEAKHLHTPNGLNDLPDEWQWLRLEDACEGIFDCPHSTPTVTEFGPLMVRTQDILSEVFRAEEAAHVSEETYLERIKRAEPRYGDLLYSREGTYFGIAAEVPPNQRICLGQRMVLLRPNAKVIQSRFLRYWLNSPVVARYVSGFRDGSVAQRLNLSTIRALPVLIPPLHIQQSIACFLGALDDKIELNRRMNQTLEGIARALFKSWFVDFDPVYAKAGGQQPPGLAPHIADLFPDEFEESELGEIPKGWRVGTLSDLVTNVIERAHPSAFTESIPYVPIGCISPRTICLSESLPGSDARSSLILFKSGDILFGAMRPYFHKVCIAPFDGTTRTTAFVLRPEESELGYAAFVVSRDETIDYATAHSEGSTIPYAKWAGSLELFPITLPPRELRQGFHDLVEPIIHKLMGSVVESHTLAAVRDTLLPKLISGELRVPDAEHFVGEAL